MSFLNHKTRFRAPMLAMAAALFIAYQMYSLASFLDSQDWVETHAKITHAHRSQGRNDSASIRYRYVWQGQEYSGSRVRFGMWTTNGDLNDYRQGQTACVFVDPERPSSSTLQRDYSTVGIAFFGISVTTLLGTISYMICPPF